MENDMKFKWWEPYVYTFLVVLTAVWFFSLMAYGSASFILFDTEPLQTLLSLDYLRFTVSASFVVAVVAGVFFQLDQLGKK